LPLTQYSEAPLVTIKFLIPTSLIFSPKRKSTISIEGNIPSNIFDESSKLKGASLIFISDLSLNDISGSI